MSRMLSLKMPCWLKHLAVPALVLAGLLGMPAQAQVDDLAKVFAPIDANLRRRLAERLKLYVEYERTHQWDKLYDLTSKQQLKNESREEFVKRKHPFSGSNFPDMLDFIPQSTATSFAGIEDEYFIEVCIKVRWKGRVRRWLAGMDVFWEGGDWYFSSVHAMTGVGAPPRPCRK